jgi:Protein of unknown function (DUF3303)
MLYMIIETFRPGKVKQLYKRFEERGRQLPDGVRYLDSWIDEKIITCYQVMESDSPERLQKWTELWADFCDFRIIAVITSAEAGERVRSIYF